MQTVKFDMPIAQQAAGPGKYWVLLYNQPGSGADVCFFDDFSTIHFRFCSRRPFPPSTFRGLFDFINLHQLRCPVVVLAFLVAPQVDFLDPKFAF